MAARNDEGWRQGEPGRASHARRQRGCAVYFGDGTGRPLRRLARSTRSSQVTARRLVLAAILLGCVTAVSTSPKRVAAVGEPVVMPDWSGQWENVGATPDASGGFNETLDDVLKKMQWSPPQKPELQARVEKIQARERHRLDL